MHRSESAAGLRRIEGNAAEGGKEISSFSKKRFRKGVTRPPLVSRVATSLSEPSRCFYAREAFLPFLSPLSFFLLLRPLLLSPLHTTDSLIFSSDFVSFSLPLSFLCERYPEKLYLHFHKDRVGSGWWKRVGGG